MKLKDSAICWDGKRHGGEGAVLVVPLKDYYERRAGWHLQASTGGMFPVVAQMTRAEQMLFVTQQALELIGFYECDAQAVEKEFSKIDEYRAARGVLMSMVAEDNLSIFRGHVRDPNNSEGFWSLK